MNLSIFHNARFQPAPDQADQARISNSMFNKPEQPLVIETPEEPLDRLPTTTLLGIRSK
jgi:hypothetical protein